MPPRLVAFSARLKNLFAGLKNARLRRRRAMSSLIARRLPHIRVLLLTIGYVWLFALPSSFLGRGTYIDENALQPSQVNTYWNWDEVHRADLYLKDLETLRDSNATNIKRAEFLLLEFEKLGFHAATQSYNFTISSNIISGVNSYAIFSAPRTSGTEAMVISASWISRMGEGRLNLRGIATVLALASHLKKYSHWARDIIFVIGDDHLPGMHAWLSAYHGDVQSNLDAQPLGLTSGVIWTALNIDYPKHSFSHLGVFHEGLNGRLPNQDLFNSLHIISRHTGGVPVVLYDNLDPRESKDISYPPAWVPSIVKTNPALLEFSIRARNIARHMYYQAKGKGSGVHALYHRYRIDAITLFAVPADGPHGFYSIGKVIESTLRTMNNLLERLHASFFFYILTTPERFLKIGHYLPSVIMISVATMFGGLRGWVEAGWRKGEHDDKEKKPTSSEEAEWVSQRRPVIDALLVMLATHAMGALLFFAAWKGWAFSNGFLQIGFKPSYVITAALKFLVLSNLCAWLSSRIRALPGTASLSAVLKPLILCLTSTFVSVTSLLNFSLAALLCVVLVLPLTLLLPTASDSRYTRDIKHTLLVTHAMLVPAYLVDSASLWDWSVLGVWFSPFICVICVPLLLQAAVVCAEP